MNVKRNVIVFIMIMLFLTSAVVSVYSQPTNLTEREMLIQLTEKINYIEQTVRRIDENSVDVNEKIYTMDRRVTKNEMDIGGFIERLKELVARWNALIGIFSAFVLGMFIWMWKRSYNGKKSS